MKRKITKTLALLAAFCGLQLFAATPVATWTDFTNPTSGGYTLTIDDSCIIGNDGSVTIGANGGLKLSLPENDTIRTSGLVTIVADVENILPTGDKRTIFAIKDSDGNVINLTKNADGTIYSKGNDATGYGNIGNYATIGRAHIAYAYSAASGTDAWVEKQKKANSTSLHWSNRQLTDIFFGSYNGTTQVMQGLKIHKLTIFADKLTSASDIYGTTHPNQWFKFNGNYDNMGLADFGSLGENAQNWNPGIHGQAMKIVNGSTHPYGGSWDYGSGNWTVTVAAKPIADASNRIVLWSTGTSGGNWFVVSTKSSDNKAYLTYKGTDICSVSIPNITDYFHLITVRFVGNNTYELIVDDNIAGKATGTWSGTVPSGSFQIGAVQQGCPSGYARTTGTLIDDLRVYKRALSDAELTELAAEFRTPETISINIGGGRSTGDLAADSDHLVQTSECVGLAPAPGAAWNNLAKQWQSGASTKKFTMAAGTVKVTDGTKLITRDAVAVDLQGNNTYDGGVTRVNAFHKGYIDDGDYDSHKAYVKVTNVPYSKYNVIVYSATDTGSTTYGHVKVNGTNYKWDSYTKVGTGAWGDSNATATEYGKNALIIQGVSGATLEVEGTKDGGRGGIAAVQVVDCNELKGCVANIAAGANITWADITWRGGTPTGDKDATLNLAGDATITVNAAAACANLIVKGAGTLTLNAGDNLTCTKITSERPLVITTAKNQAVDTGANNLVYNYTGAAMSGTEPNVTCTGNLTFGGNSELKWTKTIDTGKTFTVADTCKVHYWGNNAQVIKGTVVIQAGATFLNTRDYDVLQYSGSPLIKVYGTLDMGSTRWTVRGNNVIKLFPGGQLIGAGHATYKAIDFENSSSGNVIQFDLGGAASGTAKVTAGLRDRNAAPTFNIPAGMLVEFGSAFTSEYSTERTLTKSGDGVLKPIDALRVPSRFTVSMTAGGLDLSAMTGKSSATQFAGGLTVAEGVAIRFPAGQGDKEAFTLCGGTLTAPAKVRNATVYIGDSATPVEGATLIYDTENKTVAYTTQAPGSITITGNATIADVIAAIKKQEGEEYADDIMVTMDDGATLTVEKTFAYPKLTLVNAGAAVIDYQLTETDTYAKMDLQNVTGAITLTTSVKLPIAAGARNLTYNYNGADAIDSSDISTDGTFTKGGTGRMNVNFGSSRTAATIINGGTLAFSAQMALGNGADITVNEGATLDFNSHPNGGSKTKVILNGGTMKNGTEGGGGTGQMQIKELTLTADSAIDTPYEFGMVGSQYSATTIDVGTFTLTKRGAGAFHISTATISGTGKILVEAGTLNFFNTASTFSNGTVELAGGTLNRDAKLTAGAVSVTANSTITGGSALTAPVTISNSAVLTCTGLALPLNGVSLVASQAGTLKITKPTAAVKVATATATVEGLALVDAEDTALMSCTYNGFFWYGQTGGTYTLTDDDKTAIGALTQGAIFTKSTTYVDLSAVVGTPEGYYAWVEGSTAYVAKKSNSISIKFGRRSATEGTIGTTDANVGGYPVAGKFWNHSKIWNNNNAGTTEIFQLSDGNGVALPGVLCYYYTPNTYFANNDAQTTGNGKMTRTYFDDTDRVNSPTFPYSVGTYGEREYFLPATPTKDGVTANLRWEVAITNIPYQVFDLYIYQASDQTTSSIKLMPIAAKANDGEWKYFAGDNAGSTAVATYDTIWDGAAYCDQTSMTEGTHYIRYRLSKAALGLSEDEEISVIYLSHPKKHDSARLGVAGVQIVLVENDGYYTRKADAGTNDWLAEGSWLNSSKSPTTWQNPAGKDVAYATIDGDTVTTINIDGEVHANNVTLVNTAPGEGESEKTFTFTRSNGGTLTSPVDATGFHGKVVPCEGMTSAIALGSDAYIEVNVPAGTEVAIENILPAGVTIIGGSVKIVGEGTVICDGALPTAYASSFQANTWNGTVWIKNVHIAGTVLKDYANANSKVKVTGLTGWMNDGDQQLAELILANDGETIAYENDDSSTNYKYTYAKFSGNGTFKFATKATSAAGIAIADVSEFTGALLSVAGTNRTAKLPTTGRPIYVGTSTVTADTTSLISVADGATINSGCGWQAATAAFGSTLTVKGAELDVVVGGITTAPTLNTTVTLKDRTTGEPVSGTYCLAYDAAATAVKVTHTVQFTAPTIAGASTITVTGGTIAEGTVTAYYGLPFAITYTVDAGKVFSDGANTKTVNIDSVTTGEAAVEAITTALEGVTTVDAQAKIGTTYYLTFAAAVEAANAMPSATVEPLVDATITAEMAVNETVSFNIAQGRTLTILKGGFKATQFTNNGTIAFNGGTADAPIEIMGDAASNFGTMTLAANTHVYNKATDNRKHLVTGVGATSYYYLDGHGLSDDTSLNNLTLVSLGTGNGVWIERGIGENVRLTVLEGKVVTIGNNDLTYNAPFIALNGAGTINPKKNSTLTINCSEAATYSGASSIAITIGGTALQTLSGAYTGALTVNEGGQAALKVGATYALNVNNAGTLRLIDNETTKTTLTAATFNNTGTLDLSGTGIDTLAIGTLTSFGTVTWPAEVAGTVKITSGGATRDFSEITSKLTGFLGAVELDITETLAENAAGQVALTGAPANAKIVLTRIDGTVIEGTATAEGGFTQDVTVLAYGAACYYDFTFTNTITTAKGSRETYTLETEMAMEYNAAGDALLLYCSPWNQMNEKMYNLSTFSVAMYGKVSATNNTFFISFGSGSANHMLFLATNEDGTKVNVVYYDGTNHTLSQITVPHMTSASHLYVFSKVDARTLDIYLDGALWERVTTDFDLVMGSSTHSGVQFGSGFGTRPSPYIRVPSTDKLADVGTMRIFDYVISDKQLAALKTEFPYDSPDTYARTVDTATTNWVSAAAWTKGGETFDTPDAKGAVKVTADANTTVSVNLGTETAVNYEKVTFAGEKPIKLALAQDNTIPVKATQFEFETDVTVTPEAIDLGSAQTTSISANGKLTIDLSGIDCGEYTTNFVKEITGTCTDSGLVEAGKLAIIKPTEMYGRDMTIIYQANKKYAVEVALAEDVTAMYWKPTETVLTNTTHLTDAEGTADYIWWQTMPITVGQDNTAALTSITGDCQNTVFLVNSGVAFDIGTLRTVKIGGDGGVKAQLETDPQPGDEVTLFTVASGTPTVAELKDSKGDVIDASYYTYANGVVTFKKEAAVGTTYYFTLKQAIEAQEAAATIALLADVTDAQSITVGQNITLDGDTNILENVEFTFSSATITFNSGCIGVAYATGMNPASSICRFAEAVTNSWASHGPAEYSIAKLSTPVRAGTTYQYEFVKSSFVPDPAKGEELIPVVDQNGNDAGAIKLDSTWVATVTGESDPAAQAIALNQKENNGLMNWQNEILGLQNAEGSIPVVSPQPDQSTAGEGKISFFLNGCDVAADSGATVTYKVMSRNTTSGEWTAASDDTAYNEAASVKLPDTGVKYYKFDVNISTSK